MKEPPLHIKNVTANFEATRKPINIEGVQSIRGAVGQAEL